jgi:hypothetical protein
MTGETGETARGWPQAGRGESADMDTNEVQLRVNLNSEAAGVLQRIMEQRDISATEAVRRAIAVYDLVEQEFAAGNRLQIVGQSGHVREIHLL